MQQSGEERQGVCAREGNELSSEKQKQTKDIKHCLQQSAKTEIAIFSIVARFSSFFMIAKH